MMRKSIAIAMGAVFVAWTFSQAQSTRPATAPAGDRPAKPENPDKPRQAEQLSGELGEMARTLGFSDELKAKLLEKVKAGKAAQDAWEKDNAPKVKQLQEEIGKLKQELKALEDAKNAMLSDQKNQVRELISPEQNEAWQKHRLKMQMLGQYRQMALTDEQKGKIGTLCDEAAKEMSAMTAEQRSSGEWDVYARLNRSVSGIVTAEQKASAASENMYAKARSAFKAAGLTPEQDARIKELSQGAAREYVQVQEQFNKAESDTRTFDEKRRTAFDSFVKGASQLVLTEEQRAKLSAAASQPATRGAKQGAREKSREKIARLGNDKSVSADKPRNRKD
ncbi:MAG: hypothetical protein HZA50_07770 [Planctomycetes bacterium]|nr:hypothetical protein [Planctomycetota bacterium]